MVLCGNLIEERAECLVGGPGAFLGAQAEGVDALHRDLGEHAQRAEAEGDRAQVVVAGGDRADLTGAGDQLGADDLGGDTAETQSGAVGSGGDGPGDGLPVDISQVCHRKSVRRKQSRDLVQVCAGVQGDLLACGVDPGQAAHVAQVEPDVVSGGDRGETVPGADRFHGGPGFGSPGDDPGDLQRVGRELGAARRATDRAAPIMPAGSGRLSPRKVLAHRKHFPSPR